MYLQDFFIKDNVWNNAFSFDIRENKSIFVPSLIEVNDLNDVKVWDYQTFSDIDFDWNLVSYKWLKNFYKYDYKGKDVFIFDNHNHRFYFWFEAFKKAKIQANATLIHIDEHSDIRDPWVYLDDYSDLQKVFDYTNFTLNVWNYIVPAIKSGLINEVIQIRSEISLLEYKKEQKKYNKNIILNLDLDFFEPNLDYIDYNLKKEIVLEVREKADLITICTSPYFIDQDLALKVLRDLF